MSAASLDEIVYIIACRDGVSGISSARNCDLDLPYMMTLALILCISQELSKGEIGSR